MPTDSGVVFVSRHEENSLRLSLRCDPGSGETYSGLRWKLTKASVNHPELEASSALACQRTPQNNAVEPTGTHRVKNHQVKRQRRALGAVLIDIDPPGNFQFNPVNHTYNLTFPYDTQNLTMTIYAASSGENITVNGSIVSASIAVVPVSLASTHTLVVGFSNNTANYSFTLFLNVCFPSIY